MGKLEKTEIRSAVLEKLKNNLDYSSIPNDENCRALVKGKFEIDNARCKDIERNTRKQNGCTEWYEQRKCRLTSSLFGSVLNRRKSIYPKSIVNKITQQTQTRNASCQWGIQNEHNALLRYHQLKCEANEEVDVCAACGLVVNPKWPWLGASPDALIADKKEKSVYGGVEVKCPASKCKSSIIEACDDKSFCLELVNGKPCLKKRHIYYFQAQGVMAICQLEFLDFVVYTLNDIHVERIFFNKIEWDEHILPELSSFYFAYLIGTA